MEEVDSIIIRNLRSIGCNIDDDVRSLRQFSTALVVEATACCLRTIDNTVDINHRLPPSMAAQFRIGANLATAVQNLGYRGDVGYHTFLYSNEVDIRRVLMFLVDRLPKEHTETGEQSLGRAVVLQKQIAAELARRMARVWSPSFYRAKPTSGIHEFKTCRLVQPNGSTAMKEYCAKLLPYICQQPSDLTTLPASIIETNTANYVYTRDVEVDWSQQGLASRLSRQEYVARKRDRLKQKIAAQLHVMMQSNGTPLSISDQLSVRGSSAGPQKLSRFAHVERHQFTQDAAKLSAQMSASSVVASSSESEQQKWESEMATIQNTLTSVISQVDEFEFGAKNLTLGTQQFAERLRELQNSNREKEEVARIKKATLDLFPDAENNIARLEAMIDGIAKRLINLSNQWEKHRVALIENYRQLKDLSSEHSQTAEKQLSDLQELQEKMRQLTAEAREKDALHKQLVVEYEQMTKDVNRSAYTQRILEIVGNIRKQNQDIDKILIDTRAIQKEINLLTGKLDRTFSVTDELIFRDARKDDAVRKAYKYLAAFHENCTLLIKTVEETGVITREIRDLEDQLDPDDTKKLAANLERISTDYQQMHAENVTLLTRLKSLNTNVQ
jgi:hypothetical protein